MNLRDIVTLFKNHQIQYGLNGDSENQMQELYKWELVSKQNGHPDPNAVDFSKEINSLEFKNLCYSSQITAIRNFVKYEPEEYRKLFRALFDENILLQKEGFKHPENKKHKGGIYLFEDHSGIRYPDFYKDDIVLDAKYKKLESYEKVSNVKRDDIHQLITYITNLQASKGVFIAPLTERQQKIPKSRLKDSSASLYILGIEICHTSTSYADFCEKMKAKEAFFVDTLRQL